MKQILDHAINELNEGITITADAEDVTVGNASHVYEITYNGNVQVVNFQHGPVKENGINGISNEALLAIVLDRLRGFQSGQFACRENAVALTHLETSLMWLQKRTRDRVLRGVEGTLKI